MKIVLKSPHITEKSATLQATFNHYVFIVEQSSNKIDIKREVESLKKGIEVESVRISNVRGKEKRVGQRMGKQSNWKKAIVRLKAGQTLEMAETA